MRSFRAWILILTLLASGTVYGADICQAIFRSHGPLLDDRYGSVSQNDDYLWYHGLIGPEGSQLCGPTCLYNSLEKFHRIEGTKPVLSGPKRIEDLVDHVFARRGEVVRYGSNVFEMGNAFVRALREEKIPASVHLFASNERHPDYEGPVSASVLRDSVRDDTIVIAAIGRYDVRDPRDARRSRRTSGHYVIIAGYHPDNRSLFYVIDPMSPERFREMEIIPVRPDAFTDPTFVARFTDGRESGSSLIIEKLIAARRR